MTRVTLGPIQSFLTRIDTPWYHGPYEESAVLALISCFLNEAPGGLVFAVVGFILALSDHRLFSSSVGHCPDPVLLHGKFSFRWPVKARDTITFTCNEHYILKGGNWSQCREDHTWVPPFPTCKSSEYRLVGTQEQQCIDGEWNSAPPVCELIPEAPKPARQTAHEKALLAFQESEELCKAVENFMQRLKENGSTMEELKHSLETKKAELEATISP
ncbi:C4b-binding protein beta chain [Myotis brandtii]|uniref:C4b-binding protein beta chain n=1 Tax=Myotis brandtii TaxID=109478 RepID=S7Q876_MYOBR|nr:C4b-binding protein beta chain [Myotis brandtii]